MSALLCMCAPVGVYNYSDMQGDSPKGPREIMRDKGKASKEKRQRVGEDRLVKDLREGNINDDVEVVAKMRM